MMSPLEAQVTLGMRDQDQARVLQLLGRCEWQVYRTLAGYRAEGVAAAPHGNRGRSPHDALGCRLRVEVMRLLRSSACESVNAHHLVDLLAEREGMHLSVPLAQHDSARPRDIPGDASSCSLWERTLSE